MAFFIINDFTTFIWYLAHSIAELSSVCNVLFCLAGYADISRFNFLFFFLLLQATIPPSNLRLLQNEVIAGKREKGKERIHSSAIFRVSLIITNIVLTFLWS